MLSFPTTSSSTSTATSIDDKSSANLNIHGESPPPKEIPDMSSATFVSVGGDKLTLALGNKNLSTLSGSPTSSGSSPPICDKLINLDSPPPASTTAPLTPI